MPRFATVGAMLIVALAALPPLARSEEKDPLEAWDRAWEKALDAALRAYCDEADWCDRSDLGLTATVLRHRALRFRPENEELRKFLGYFPAEDGGWERSDARKLELRENSVDKASRKKSDLRRDRANARVADRFRGLARIAALRMDSDADRVADWDSRRVRALEAVLRAEPDADDAHEALDHPFFEGRYVRPEALPFLRNRLKREKETEASRATEFELTDLGPHAEMTRLGLPAHGFRSEHYTVLATHGKDYARRAALGAERAAAELCRANGFPSAVVRNSNLRLFVFLRTRSEIRRFLDLFSDWSEERIEKQLDRFSNAYFRKRSVAERLGSERVVDAAMNYACRTAVERARVHYEEEMDEGDAVDLEPWLKEALVSDVVKRLTGQMLSKFTEVPDYAGETRDVTNRDQWIRYARIRVEMDDDVPLRRLAAMRLIDLDGGAAVKSFALIQYLQELDPVRAKRWVKLALVRGSLAATERIYGRTPEELDAAYARWILY